MLSVPETERARQSRPYAPTLALCSPTIDDEQAMKAVQCLLRLCGFILSLSASALRRSRRDLAATDIGDPSRQMLVLLHLPPPHYRAGGDSSEPMMMDWAVGATENRHPLAKAHGLTW